MSVRENGNYLTRYAAHGIIGVVTMLDREPTRTRYDVPVPLWARFGLTMWGVLVPLLLGTLHGDGMGWTIATVAYGLVVLPWTAASVRWHLQHRVKGESRNAA